MVMRKLAALNNINVVRSDKIDQIEHLSKSDQYKRIITFIYDFLVENSVNLENIEFLGTVYGLHHLSVRSPGLLELGFGALYNKGKIDRIGFNKKRKNWFVSLILLKIWTICLKYQHIYRKNSRYFFSSTQRLQLVDERSIGTQKLMDAFRVNNAKFGVIGWYGVNQFEIMLISKKL